MSKKRVVIMPKTEEILNNDEEGTDLKRRRENDKNVFNKLKEFAHLPKNEETPN